MAADTWSRSSEADGAQRLPIVLAREARMCSALLIDAANAARLLGISLSHLFQLRRSGKFGPTPTRLGRATRFSCPEIQAWVAAGTPGRDRWESIRGQHLKQR